MAWVLAIGFITIFLMYGFTPLMRFALFIAIAVGIMFNKSDDRGTWL